MKAAPPTAPAATLVVFGAKGDLTRRLLVPALANLVQAKLLDDKTQILGVDHNELTREEFIDVILKSVKDRDARHWIEKRAHFLQGEFDQASTYQDLAKQLKGSAVFYLATSPRFFGSVIEQLADAGLFDEKDGFRRVVIEKPFGTDLASAEALNKQILARVSEDQVFRIDHFLGKETVQNLMIFRFANPLFEAVWNSRYVDHVQITAAETVDVGTRATFYDATGALRDMVPNHLFQLLSIVGMEPPNSFDADAIRTEKAKVVTAVRPVEPDDAVRGVYEAGKVDGKAVVAYVKAEGVDPKSHTETYAAMKVMVDTWRWADVPFYLRTGKAMTARDTEIVITFRQAPMALFKHLDGDPPTQNRLVIRIQPNEGIGLTFSLKPPGPMLAAEAQDFDFRYDKIFKLEGQTGYETLLYDVLTGDQTLFQRADQIEGGWRAVQAVQKAWAKSGKPNPYAAGSAGPAAADALLSRDGRQWHPIG